MRVVLVTAILLLLNGFALQADPSSQSWEKPVRIEITETAYPFIPSQSQLSIEWPVQAFLGAPPLSRITFDAWYKTASAYFVPEPFFEIGTIINYSFTEGRSYQFLGGIGTAYSKEGDTVSIPFISSFQFNFFRTSWFEFESSLQGQIYAEGLIASADLKAFFRPFGRGLIVGVGPGSSFGYNWTTQYLALSFSLSATIAYAI